MADSLENARERVWQVVAAIPEGRVATYGQIAAMAGMPNQSRLVGRVLSRLPAGTRLPWHRVINARGTISNPNCEQQRRRLEAEGVTLIAGRIRLQDYRWSP